MVAAPVGNSDKAGEISQSGDWRGTIAESNSATGLSRYCFERGKDKVGVSWIVLAVTVAANGTTFEVSKNGASGSPGSDAVVVFAKEEENSVEG